MTCFRVMKWPEKDWNGRVSILFWHKELSMYLLPIVAAGVYQTGKEDNHAVHGQI